MRQGSANMMSMRLLLRFVRNLMGLPLSGDMHNLHQGSQPSFENKYPGQAMYFLHMCDVELCLRESYANRVNPCMHAYRTHFLEQILLQPWIQMLVFYIAICHHSCSIIILHAKLEVCDECLDRSFMHSPTPLSVI